MNTPNFTRAARLPEILKQRIVVDTELVDEVCLENEKSAQRMK